MWGSQSSVRQVMLLCSKLYAAIRVPPAFWASGDRHMTVSLNSSDRVAGVPLHKIKHAGRRPAGQANQIEVAPGPFIEPAARAAQAYIRRRQFPTRGDK